MLGKDTAAEIKEELDKEIGELKARGVMPHLQIIRVGDRPEDRAYEKGAGKRFEKLGMELGVTELPEDVSEGEFEKALAEANDDPLVHGILIFRPLPKNLDEEKISEMIAPGKDVDCFGPVNTAKVMTGDEGGFAPCTAEAAIEIGERNGIDFDGKKVAVIGRSMVVGRPLAMMLIRKNATVTVCHSYTKDLAGSCRDADVVISAAGSAGLIKADMVREGVCVIDVGINVTEDGKLTGDVDFDPVAAKAEKITPVPGGVGGVTTSILARHVVRAAERLAAVSVSYCQSVQERTLS